MENFTLDIAENEIERQCLRRRELEEERRALLDRIERTDSARQSVKEPIYQRVRKEYETLLRAVENELEPLAAALDEGRASIRDQIENIDVEDEGLRDRLDELAFRHHVGEFDERAFEEARLPIEQQHERLVRRRRELSEMLCRLEGTPPSPGSSREEDCSAERVSQIGTPTDPAQHVSTQSDPGSPQDEPRNTTSDDQSPETRFDPPETEPEPTGSEVEATDTLPHATEGSRTSSHENREASDEFVDLAEWVGEFVPDESENGTADDDEREQTSTAPHAESQPARPVPQPSPETGAADSPGDPPADPGDSLFGLADPWEESVGSTEEAARKETNRGYHDVSPHGLPILAITGGPGAGKRLPLLPMTMTLGREADNNIELKDEDVARYHARISYESGKYVIQDLEGSSGTYVNGEKITRTALSPGDVIRVGNTEMSLDLG